MIKSIGTRIFHRITRQVRQDGVTDCLNCQRGYEKCGLTRIFHRISRQIRQYVAPDSFSNIREHCPGDKARIFEDEDGVTDCLNCQRGYEKYGLTRIFHRITRQVRQDGAPDSFSNIREHCPGDKARIFEDEDGVTDCLNCQRGYEKCGFYLIFIIGILCWWTLAFQNKDIPLRKSLVSSKENVDIPIFKMLSTMDRDSLKKALNGNTHLIVKMISEWDIDAQVLQSNGILDAKRITRKDYYKSQVLGRKLLNTPIKKTHYRFLPQTYVSASFLLSLASPEEIVAIPQGLRNQTQLYPKELTDKIPIDIDRYHSELIFLSRPHVAFVADYSHPSTIQALQNQGIDLITLPQIQKVEDIQKAIQEVGLVIENSDKAELMSIFIDAALLAIDNRLLAYRTSMGIEDNPEKILYVNYYSNYSIPTMRTLTGQLLARLGVNHSIETINSSEWSISIEPEKILQYAPDTLIIATPNCKILKGEHFFQDFPMERVFYLDDTIQNDSSHQIVIGYYDLFQTIMR